MRLQPQSHQEHGETGGSTSNSLKDSQFFPHSNKKYVQQSAANMGKNKYKKERKRVGPVECK